MLSDFAGSAGFVIAPYQGSDVDPTISSAILVNAHARNFWSADYWTTTDKFRFGAGVLRGLAC